MIDLFLVRHGESEANAKGKIAGITDVPLSGKGLQQAGALKDFLQKNSYKFDLVYSSPLSRAYNTILPFTQENNYEIITDTRLQELNLGPRENAFIHEFKSEDFYEDCYCFTGEDDIESYEQVVTRVREFLHEKIYPQKGKKILISCHAGVVRAFVAALNELTREVPRLIIPNASLTHYRVDELTRIARCEKFSYDVHLRNNNIL